MAIRQGVVGVSAGGRWQVLTTNQVELFSFLQRLKSFKEMLKNNPENKTPLIIALPWLYIAGLTITNHNFNRVSSLKTGASDHEQLRTKKPILILILARPAHVLGQLYTFQAL